ncbi:MAG TPA: Ig-like domain-containing protein [Gemmatimonadales bacterium]|nr:Ig-like domain-containing protein [Gemmatimonadales bacterium]
MSLVHAAASPLAFAVTACLAIEGTPSSQRTPSHPDQVASVPVTPASGVIPVGQSLQLNATPKDSAGAPVAGLAVTWTTSDSAVATVDDQGRVTGLSQGSVIITATSGGKSGTAIVTVQGAPLAAGSPDPTLLPVANGQLPDVLGYTALNVPSQPAGFSYLDPVTGVRVWKVTSSTVPTPNRGAGHDYSDGPNEVSLGWGPNTNTHTILIGAPQAVRKYYLVDFTSGVGFSNYRRLTLQPDRDLCVSFSNVQGQERIVYILTPTQIVRYNTATMQVENAGNFPLDLSAVGGFSWLQHDKNDIWFAGLTSDQNTAFAWNSQTNEFLTHAETWLNEPRLERDGRYIALTNSNSTFRLWDLTTNTFGPTQSDRLNYWLGHNANLRSQWVSTDVNADAPFDLDRYYPSGGEILKVQIFNNSAGAGVHHSGNWVQSDAELGGNLNQQWSIFSGIDNNAFTATAKWKQGIGAVRSDGSDARLLLHHYDVNPAALDYFADPFAQTSPDGKLVIFNSNMLASGRYDLFVAEMPLR